MPRYTITHTRGSFQIVLDYDKKAFYEVGDLFTSRGVGPPVLIEQGTRLVVELGGIEGERDSVVEIRRG